VPDVLYRAWGTATWLALGGTVVLASSWAGEPLPLVGLLSALLTVFSLGYFLRRLARPLRVVSAVFCGIGLMFGLVAATAQLDADGSARQALVTLGQTLVVALALDRVILLAAQAGRSPLGRGLARAGLGVLLVADVSLVAMGAYRIAPDVIPPTSRSQLTRYVFAHLRTSYPHASRAPIPIARLEANYRPRLEQADRECGAGSGRCTGYYRLLREMLGQLTNGHTGVTIPGDLALPDLDVELIGGVPVITRWAFGSGRDGGSLVGPGTVILAVDGRPPVDVVRGLPPWLVTAASPQRRVYDTYRRLLAGEPGTEVTLTVREPGGRVQDLVFERYADEDEALEGQGEGRRGTDRNEADPPADGEDHDDPADLVWGTQLDDPPYAYVRLVGFSAAGVTSKFDRVLGDLELRSGMVLDLRGNHGGQLDQMLRIVGRFFDRSWTIGHRCVHRRSLFGDSMNCSPFVVSPRRPIVPYPVAVLVDETTFSAGELAAYTLCRSDRARCFGRTTAGETDCVRIWSLDGVRVGLASCEFRPVEGPSLLGVGVAPHETVMRTVSDLLDERDPELEAAVDWLTSRKPTVSREVAARRD
jgi:C-terminal processing protease CtpA/Prc